MSNKRNFEENNISNNCKEEFIKVRPGMLGVINTHPYALVSPNRSRIPLIKDFPVIDSPIMVVGESLRNFKNIHNENTGELKAEKGRYQCKCIWFNHKTGVFEETWLSSRLLMFLEIDSHNDLCENSGGQTEINGETEGNVAEESLVKDEIKVGSIVSLKSLPFEKKKLSRLYETRASAKTYEVYKSTAIHDYEPPVMEVIETKNMEVVQKFDVKSGCELKFSPKRVAKCKWFNTFFNKFSESWLPVEVLIKRDENYEEFLPKIIEDIKKGKVYVTADYLFKPAGLNSDGFYLNIEGVNLFTNNFQTVGVNKIIGREPIDEKDCFLDFHNCKKLVSGDELDRELRDSRRIAELTKLIDGYCSEGKAIRILYKNLKGKLTSRVLTDYRIERNSKLLSGFCHLRRAERRFNLVSIKTIEKVEFGYSYLKNRWGNNNSSNNVGSENIIEGR